MAVKYKYNNLYYKEKELEEPIARIIATHTKLKQVIGFGKSFEMSLFQKVMFLVNHGELLKQLTVNHNSVAFDLGLKYGVSVSALAISKCNSLKDVIDYIIFLINKKGED